MGRRLQSSNSRESEALRKTLAKKDQEKSSEPKQKKKHPSEKKGSEPKQKKKDDGACPAEPS